MAIVGFDRSIPLQRFHHRHALHEYGLVLNPAYVTQELTKESEARDAIGRMLALPASPTAFVAASDIVAISAMSYATPNRQSPAPATFFWHADCCAQQNAI